MTGAVRTSVRGAAPEAGTLTKAAPVELVADVADLAKNPRTGERVDVPSKCVTYF